MKALSEQEIHQLAMQEVGGFLEAEGYEFLAVNSEMKRSPQFSVLRIKYSILLSWKDVSIQNHLGPTMKIEWGK